MTASTGTLQKRAILLLDLVGEDAVGAAEEESGWIPIESSSLTECCVGLVFSSSEALMYGTRVRCTLIGVAAPRLLAELPDRLEERQRLDVADRAADLDEDDVGLGADLADRLLDLVGDVRDDLHGLAEVVAAPLALDDRHVDPAGRRVVDPRARHRREPLVVAEVEVGLGAVVGDVDLAVLEGRHRARDRR